MNTNTIPVHDWVSLAIGIFGFLAALLARRDLLPPGALRWMKRIRRDRIMAAVERAASITDLPPEERRSRAAAYLRELSESELGIRIPSSIANLLIEHIYQQWKGKTRK